MVLVRLNTNILCDAKLLWQSTCNYTRLNTYINPDRTHIEMDGFKKYRKYRRNNTNKNSSVPCILSAINHHVMSIVSTVMSPLRIAL